MRDAERRASLGSLDRVRPDDDVGPGQDWRAFCYRRDGLKLPDVGRGVGAVAAAEHGRLHATISKRSGPDFADS